MNDIINELKQEMRQQKFEDALVKNGSKILAFAVLLVLATTAGYFYKQFQIKKNIEAGKEFLAIVDGKKSPQEKSAELDAFIKSAPKGYAAIAELKKADDFVFANKLDDAKATFESVSKNSTFEQAFREIAELKLVDILIKQGENEADILKRLDALSGDLGVFKYSALEMKANYFLANERKKDAADIYNKLIQDPLTPQNISKRAKQFIPAVEGVKASEAVATEAKQ